MITGFLLKVKKEGPESCNCHDEAEVDYHLWLADDATDDRSEAMVVEVSPRERPDHTGWTLAKLQGFVKQHAKIRISGWLMWDQEHPEQLGKTRASLWEVHPIHRIEVFARGKWVTL